MAEELYINDQLMDLPDRVVSQTLQINDIGDVQDRQANYSNSIKIPRTSNNIRILEMLGIAGNTTRVPYENVKIRYVVDGVELISEGKGVVKNTNNFFNLVIYDGGIALAELLGGSTLSELDFSAHNHNLTEPLFISSFGNTEGYIYALGKFYENASTTVINVDLQNVSFYMHTLFSMIFTQRGYSLEGAFFTDSSYKNRLVSMDTGYDRTVSGTPSQVYLRDNSGDAEIFEIFGAVPTTKEYLKDSYTTAKADVFRFTMEGTFTLYAGTNVLLKVYVGGILEVNRVLVSEVSEDFSLSIEAGKLIEIKISVDSTLVGPIETINFRTDYITTIFEENLQITINIEDLIGDVRQIDFVKETMQRYGLIFRKVRNQKVFEFVRMGDLLADTDGAEDWSDKYSLFVDESYNPGYGQKNIFKYTYETEDTREGQTFADGEMQLDNLNLAQEKTLLTSLFKSSVLKVADFYGLKHWTLEDTEIAPSKDGLRIFERKDINTSITYKFNDSIKNNSAFSGDIAYLDFEPVKYQNEIDNNYVEFNSMLNDYSKIILKLNLTLIDVYALDFFKLKYFKQLGAYYYLNKVSNFKKNKLTSCELVRIGKA